MLDFVFRILTCCLFRKIKLPLRGLWVWEGRAVDIEAVPQVASLPDNIKNPGLIVN